MTVTGDKSFKRLIEIGLALSQERDHNRLMERILQEAKSLCNADAGTLYLRNDDDTLRFEIMLNDTKPDLNAGGTSGNPVPAFPIRLYNEETGEPNHKNVASHVALNGETINIPDAYADGRFNPDVDKKTGFRTRSILSLPIKNQQGVVFAVAQLLNRNDGQPFDPEDEIRFSSFIESIGVIFETLEGMSVTGPETGERT